MLNPFQTKIHAHPDRICEWLKTHNTTPVVWEIDLTNRCHHRCRDCVAGAWSTKRDELSLGQAQRFLKEMKALDTCGVIFTGGGEPLLHPMLNECLRYAHDLGLFIGLITNGGLGGFDWTTARRVCTWLRFSVDAYDSASFRSSHGVDGEHWSVLLEEITRCVAAPGPAHVGFGYLTDAATQEGMVKATRLAVELGVSYIQFRPYLTNFTSTTTVKHEALRFFEQLSKCQKLATDHFDVFWSVPKYEKIRDGTADRPYTTCWGSSWAGTICADAKVYFCCHTRGLADWCIGDLAVQSLHDVWTSQRRQQVARNPLDKCPLLCRCDDMNRMLDLLRRPVRHCQFL